MHPACRVVYEHLDVLKPTRDQFSTWVTVALTESKAICEQVGLPGFTNGTGSSHVASTRSLSPVARSTATQSSHCKNSTPCAS